MLKKKPAGVWNVQTCDNIVACVTKSGSDKSVEVHCQPLEGHGCKSHDWKLAESSVNRQTRSPSIQSRPFSIGLHHFWTPKRLWGANDWRRHQAVCAELVHNAAPGILGDRHSRPCVTVGQVLQYPGPILLVYRYWFLFLSLLLVFFFNAPHNLGIYYTGWSSISVEQAVACAPVTQRARVRSPVRTSFLGDFFSGFFLTYKTDVRKL